MSFKGKINVYTCDKGHTTVTIDIDDGVTPFMIGCKHKEDEGWHSCTEMAKSCFYRADQSLTPEYEWYKPANSKGMNAAEKEHYRQGGLSLRKVIAK